jgi:hypothetical protein
MHEGHEAHEEHEEQGWFVFVNFVSFVNLRAQIVKLRIAENGGSVTQSVFQRKLNTGFTSLAFAQSW